MVGYEAYYEVSSYGRVKRVKGGGRAQVGHILTPYDNTYGYRNVDLCTGSGQAVKKVHRLVAEAFLEPVEGKPEINHKDGDKTNNRVENLELSMRSANVKHSYEVGLATQRTRQRSKQQLTDEMVSHIKGLLGVVPPKGLAAYFGCSRGMIYKIKSGEVRRWVS